MLIMKFGGTSVGSAQNIEKVASLVKGQLARRPVVVVSAITRITDALIQLANECHQKQEENAYLRIKTVHDEIILQLALDPSLLSAELQELLQLCKKSRKKKLDTKTLDHFQSFGERMSSKIVAAQLVKIGVNAKAYPAWEIGMITDSKFGDSEPLPESVSLMKTKIEALRHVPVITGFIGKTKKGEIITLGRGGSDYTAAIIGAAIDAECIQIWTDVNGIMTADPRIVPDARTIPKLAFEEACELAYFGAKVLHPKTILPAMHKSIPVQVLNTFEPKNKGTTIVSGFSEHDMHETIKAFTYKKNVIVVHIRSPEFFDGTGLLAKIFDLFAEHDTGVDVVSTSVVSVSLTIDNEKNLRKIVPELEKIGEVEVVYSKAVVCAVGGSLNAAGAAGRIFTILGKTGIKVEMISQAASGIDITFVVDDKDALDAIRILHKEHIE